MKHVVRVSIASVISFAIVANMTAQAEEADCKPVLDAMKKYVTTPNHTFVTQTGLADGKTLTTEAIYAGTMRYILVDGQWFINPANTADMLESVADKTKQSQCRLVHEEAIAGEVTALYSVQNKTETSKTDNQIWLTKRDGLFVKEESTTSGTAGTPTSRMSLRVDYNSVRAPPNAKKLDDR